MPKKISINDGDVFVIPLEGDVALGIGVVVEVTPDALNSVLCGFYDLKFNEKNDVKLDDINDDNLISIQFVTPDLLKNGSWEIISRISPVDPNKYFDYEKLKSDGYIGANIRGSSNIRKFISAYLGLYHWNCFFKDDYLDDFLLAPEKKPERIFFIEKNSNR